MNLSFICSLRKHIHSGTDFYVVTQLEYSAGTVLPLGIISLHSYCISLYTSILGIPIITYVFIILPLTLSLSLSPGTYLHLFTCHPNFSYIIFLSLSMSFIFHSFIRTSLSGMVFSAHLSVINLLFPHLPSQVLLPQR